MTESGPTDDSGGARPSAESAPSGDDPGEARTRKEPAAEERGSKGPEPATWLANHTEGFGGGAKPPPNPAWGAQPPGDWADAPAGLPPDRHGAGDGFASGPAGQYPPPAYPAYQPAPYPGGYPPSGQPPGYPVRNVGPARPTNAMAIVSLVLGILGLVLFFGVASIPAAITGHIARKQIKERDEEGAGIALAGLILGWIGVGLVVLFVGFIVVLIGIGSFATASGHS